MTPAQPTEALSEYSDIHEELFVHQLRLSPGSGFYRVMKNGKTLESEINELALQKLRKIADDPQKIMACFMEAPNHVDAAHFLGILWIFVDRDLARKITQTPGLLIGLQEQQMAERLYEYMYAMASQGTGRRLTDFDKECREGADQMLAVVNPEFVKLFTKDALAQMDQDKIIHGGSSANPIKQELCARMFEVIRDDMTLAERADVLSPPVIAILVKYGCDEAAIRGLLEKPTADNKSGGSPGTTRKRTGDHYDRYAAPPRLPVGMHLTLP